MNDIEIGDAIAKAQADIERRLAALEAETGRQVISLSMDLLDFTSISHVERRNLRAVVITTTAPHPWSSQVHP